MVSHARDYILSCKRTPRLLVLCPLTVDPRSLLRSPIIGESNPLRNNPSTRSRDLEDLILRLKYSAQEKLQKEEGRTLRGRSNASFLVRRLILTIIMAILALTYQHNFQYEGTRDGVPIYDGSAPGFTDWNFRTKVKWNAAKADDKTAR